MAGKFLSEICNDLTEYYGLPKFEIITTAMGEFTMGYNFTLSFEPLRDEASAIKAVKEKFKNINDSPFVKQIKADHNVAMKELKKDLEKAMLELEEVKRYKTFYNLYKDLRVFKYKEE